MPLVGVVMGSKTDEAVIAETSEVLDQMKIEHEVVVASAHRTPDKVRDYALSARERGIEVLIAAAGGSAGLPGSWPLGPRSRSSASRCPQATLAASTLCMR